jgi:predicted RNA-binding Zn-ribbon protein involved in translation (DUF1610 family)
MCALGKACRIYLAPAEILVFSFCPHCGRTTGQEQLPGHKLVCEHCGKVIGIVTAPAEVVIDQAEELIERGTAARCPVCGQLVEVRVSENSVRKYAPHLATAGPRKMCPNTGRQVVSNPPVASPPPRPVSAGKDLSAYRTRDRIPVISCGRESDPVIEELTLEYLDKADRVRIQIEAIRDILGLDFRLKPYPPLLNRLQLGLWGNARACVIARRHEQGGFQAMSEADIASVLDDLKKYPDPFFA